MYVYPDMELRILKGIPLNNDYDNTIYFASKSAQETFMFASAHVKYILTNNMYQRKERGWIQVNINQKDLWDCTYLAYKNTHYLNKWFYAFILNVEYINDSVSRINFEIDVIQTWIRDFILEPCFVEREHTNSDELFENTIPENVYKGDMYYTLATPESFLDLTCTQAMIVSTTDDDGIRPEVEDNVYHGMNVNHFYVSGLLYRSYDLTDSFEEHDFNHKLHMFVYNGFENNIVMIVMYPGIFSGTANFNFYRNQSFVVGTNTNTLDGYKPQNKKLFTYPYTYIKATDGEGTGNEYLLENWYNGYVGQFDITGTALATPTVNCSPYNYRKGYPNYDEGITVQCGIICSWVGDSFQVWLAQNREKEAVKSVGGILGGGVQAIAGIVSENPILLASGMVSLFSSVAGTIADVHSADKIPDSAYGMGGGSVLTNLNGSKKIVFKQMCVKAEYAKIIDEYFSRFGYACHQIKLPNLHVRKNWTYTKTVGCEIKGDLPIDDIAKLKKIFNNGVTFWSDGYNVGNFYDNSQDVPQDADRNFYNPPLR